MKISQEDKLNETELLISWKAVEHNLNYFRSLLKPSTKLMLMVKANAYGNGAEEIVKRIEKENLCDYLSVAYLDEGIALRKAGIELPIMVLNPSITHWEQMVFHCLEPEIHNLTALQSFNTFLSSNDSLKNSDYPIHLKLNTGMNRLGFDSSDLDDVIKLLQEHPSFRVKTVMSHLSSAGMPEEDIFTHSQLEKFDEMTKRLQRVLPNSVSRHILNSYGIARFPEYQLDMVRLGIGLYGGAPIPELNRNLQSICQLKTKVTSFRRLKKGASIGYSRAGKASEDTNIATLSIGYVDGLPRSLGNGNWKVEINNKLYPIIGNVCMDLTMIELGNDSAEVGDEVFIFGRQQTIFDFAKARNTIAYEVMTSIGERVRRRVVN